MASGVDGRAVLVVIMCRVILLIWGTIKFCCVVNAADRVAHNAAEKAAATLLLEAAMVPISRKLKNEVVGLRDGF